jgi:hypothetical protein
LRKNVFLKGSVTGHDFSRAEEASSKCWALAPVVFVLIHRNVAAAKAGSFFGLLNGTTQVVPCYKAFLRLSF